MKKVFTVKREEQVEVEYNFPLYLQPNQYTCVAILDEEQHLKCSVYEKWRVSTEEELQYSVYIHCAPDKYEVNKLLEEFFSDKSKRSHAPCCPTLAPCQMACSGQSSWLNNT